MNALDVMVAMTLLRVILPIGVLLAMGEILQHSDRERFGRR